MYSTRSRMKIAQRRILAGFIRCLQTFCLQTSIHGFSHIAAPKRHWTERVLWVGVTASAVWGVVHVSLGQWQRYSENPTVVTMERDFRTWTFNMPGVTACVVDRIDQAKLAAAIQSRWNVDKRNETEYEYYARFVDVVANSNLFNLSGYEEFRNDSGLNVDLLQLVIDVMPEHGIKPTAMHTVMPTEWMPVLTEYGVCHTINSLAAPEVAIVKPDRNMTIGIPAICIYSTSVCYYIMESEKLVKVIVHSPYDIADAGSTPVPSVRFRMTSLELSTTETLAGPGVRDLTPRRRHCLYIDEPSEPFRQIYSTNICRQGCRSRLAVKLCGCKPFYYIYTEGPICTPAGMFCLNSYRQTLANLKSIECFCSQQCIDSAFQTVSVSKISWTSTGLDVHGSVRLTMQFPTIRYTRYIVFHFQDLVVSFGGAAGLFLGASFVSFVEIGYFILERIFNIGRNTKTRTQTLVKLQRLPHEDRIQELTALLEGRPYYQTVI